MIILAASGIPRELRLHARLLFARFESVSDQTQSKTGFAAYENLNVELGNYINTN